MKFKAAALLLCLCFISACSAPPATGPDGVQDLKPGDKSVITDPRPQQAAPSIEERNI